MSNQLIDQKGSTSTIKPYAFVGVALILISFICWYDSLGLSAGSIGVVGPAGSLQLIAVVMFVLGISHIVMALKFFYNRAAISDDAPQEKQIVHYAGVFWVVLGVVGLFFILLLGGGFILGATWVFVLTSRSFDVSFSFSSFIFGLVMALIFFIIFSSLLKLTLPFGPLEDFINDIL